MSSVLVVGSATVDFVFEVDTLPDKPEKYRSRGARVQGNGVAANAAVAISRLEGDAHLAAQLAEDPAGQLIIAGLLMEHVSTALTTKVIGGTTAYSSIFIDRNGHTQTIHQHQRDLQQHPEWQLPELDAVFADSSWQLGALSAMKEAATRGIPGVLAAVAPIQRSALEHASHVVFSSTGLDEYMPEGKIEDRLRMAANLLNCWVCTFDGTDGIFWHGGQSGGYVPAFQIETQNIQASDDIWCGAFTLALAEGGAEIDAIRFANAAAALKMTRRGGRDTAPDREETIRFLQEHMPALR